MFSDKSGEPRSQIAHSRMPSLVALRCFEVAARHENFSRAAEELHLTHGAVSRAVRLLEDDLGVVLFERRSRRVFLTDAGRKLARAVHEGLGLMQRAAYEIKASSLKREQWVLSCEPTLLMRWLIPRWPAFRSQYPDLNIHLVAGGGPFAFSSGIDLAIRRNDFLWPDTFHSAPLFVERIGPVCRPDQVAAWFVLEDGVTRIRKDAPRLHTRTRLHAWQDWATVTDQLAPSGSEQIFEHFYFSLQAAIAGLGVAIGPWHLVQDDIRSGMLVAPMGFIEDGSCYCLLSASPLRADTPQGLVLNWLQDVGGSESN